MLNDKIAVVTGASRGIGPCRHGIPEAEPVPDVDL